MTRKGLIVLFFGISVAVLMVAVRFWLLGAWIVLPFAALEVLVLGTAFFLIERATRGYESIDLSPDAVAVLQKDWRMKREWSYQTYWVQVVLKPDPRSWYPSRLFLRSHGDSFEIGTCLCEEERQSLKRQLTETINGLRAISH